ncbi:MAG: molybdenum cofactor biosynthesis protein MoaE [Pikeienuella sp.]
MPVRVQEADFDAGAEAEAIAAGAGALVAFTGIVRGEGVLAMTLEHYPGMTEEALEAIEAEARARWRLSGALIIHRVGRLLPGERIMMVATASRHRAAAFEAAEFMMDHLKTRAPFWKKEERADGARWVDARETDERALARWNSKG